MSYTKEIVCLANSRKLSGHCIAGKQVKQDKSGAWELGGWIRPVGSPDGAELSSRDVGFEGGGIPRPLDIVRISLKRRASHKHQTENYLIDPEKYWEQVTTVDPSCLDDLCDEVDGLWETGFDSAYGKNDRVPVEKSKVIKSSLLLIKPSNVVIHHEYEFPSKAWKTRAQFLFRGNRYSLVVTDPIIEGEYRGMDAGDYPLKRSDIYMTVSLGEEYNGFCYKLVAAIIFGTKK